jgi:hypothetical protein
MLGYAMWSSSVSPPLGNHTCTPGGTLNTGTKSITLTRSTTPLPSPDDVDGWNLTGNPFVSGADWESSGWTLTNLDPTMYIWTGTAYENWNRSTHSGTKANSDIAPQQAFFVHVTSGTSGTLQVNNTARKMTSYLFPKTLSEYADKLVLTASANGYEDLAHVVFYPDATPDFDPAYDAYKLWGIDSTPNLFSYLPGNVLATCNWLPWEGKNQEVPMGFYCSISGSYSITASNFESFRSGTQVYLEDKKTTPSNFQELTANPTYTFDYVAGEPMDRFVLHFTNPYFGIDEQASQAIRIYSFEDHVYVKNLVKGDTGGDIMIYDLLGRKVFQDRLKNTAINTFRPGVEEGYYVVQVITADNSFIQRVYLQ